LAKTPEALRLSNIQQLSFQTFQWSQINLKHVRRLMPQVKDLFISLNDEIEQGDRTEFEELFIASLMQKSTEANMDSIAVHYKLSNTAHICATYSRGDSKVYRYGRSFGNDF